MVLDVRPALAAQHHADQRICHAVLLTQSALTDAASSISGSDSGNLPVSQFGTAMTSATSGTPPLSHLCHVASVGPRSKMRRANAPDEDAITPMRHDWRVIVRFVPMRQDVGNNVCVTGSSKVPERPTPIGQTCANPDPALVNVWDVGCDRPVPIHLRPEAVGDRRRACHIRASARAESRFRCDRRGAVESFTALRTGKMYRHPGSLRVSRPEQLALRRGICAPQFYQIGGY